MKIALAQLNYHIGNFEEITSKIIASIKKAKEDDANLVVFSELSICGYPPQDLLEKKSFVESALQYIDIIKKETDDIGVIIGLPVINPSHKGKNLYNSAVFIYDKKVLFTQHKTLLPTYDIFDEYRYFEPNSDFEILHFKGHNIALTICEDLWYDQPVYDAFSKNKLYKKSPMDMLMKHNPDLIINIAASPYSHNKEWVKQKVLIDNAIKYKLPLIYVNQVGAHTELIFDGGSTVINKLGNICYKLKQFEEDYYCIDINDLPNSDAGTQQKSNSKIEKIHDALIMGIKDYFNKMNFKKAVIGLSGGIDSAVTLVLAVSALGSKNVRVLLMPSKYSSQHSVDDAVQLADNLNVKYDIVNIESLVSEYSGSLGGIFKDLPEDITEENIQSRIRGTLLMAISNKFGNILLNTSNKSEMAVGYGTLYGDLSGGLSILGDVYKTEVYDLARYMNRSKEIIPVNTITKPPSAELKPDQVDTDSLPDYDIMDKILFQYIEMQYSKDDIINNGYDQEITEKIIKMVNSNEYKRYQTPPVLRISSKGFGIGRRLPLVAKYV